MVESEKKINTIEVIQIWCLCKKKLMVDELLVKVHKIVGYDPNRFVYELGFVFDIGGKMFRLNIKTDKDLHYVLLEANVNPPKIYVNV